MRATTFAWQNALVASPPAASMAQSQQPPEDPPRGPKARAISITIFSTLTSFLGIVVLVLELHVGWPVAVKIMAIVGVVALPIAAGIVVSSWKDLNRWTGSGIVTVAVVCVCASVVCVYLLGAQGVTVPRTASRLKATANARITKPADPSPGTPPEVGCPTSVSGTSSAIPRGYVLSVGYENASTGTWNYATPQTIHWDGSKWSTEVYIKQYRGSGNIGKLQVIILSASAARYYEDISLQEAGSTSRWDSSYAPPLGLYESPPMTVLLRPIVKPKAGNCWRNNKNSTAHAK